MTRGAIRPTTREEARQRVFAMCVAIPEPPPGSPTDAGHRPIAYRLEERNGGRDPFAPHCADWSYGNRVPTADCVGLVLWGSGIDRLQPRYAGNRGPWLNCAELIEDADGAQLWCEPVDDWLALPGDWLVTNSHIAMIVRPATRVLAAAPPIPTFDHLVVDCSPRHGRSTAVGLGGPWSGECRVLRYKHYTG